MLITLLSDFGYKDNFVAITKGILLQHAPEAKIIDISHDVKPHHLLQCSYLLKSAYSNFPVDTHHISLFDIMHLNPAKVLFTNINNQFIFSADNGLLPITFDDGIRNMYELKEKADNYYHWVKIVSQFISNHNGIKNDTTHLIPANCSVTPLKLKPVFKQNVLECQIIHIDRYENVVINITKEEFEKHQAGRDFNITFMRNEKVNKISKDYSDVPRGEKLFRFNSAGYLELAINGDRAASLLGLRLYNDKQIIYQTIKITFQ